MALSKFFVILIVLNEKIAYLRCCGQPCYPLQRRENPG